MFSENRHFNFYLLQECIWCYRGRQNSIVSDLHVVNVLKIAQSYSIFVRLLRKLA